MSKLRTAFGLSLLRYNPVWQPFDRLTAYRFISTTMGRQAWEVLWEPLFSGKFAQYSQEINAAWFYARIKARTKELGYPQGGFAHLAQAIVKQLEHHHQLKLTLNTPVLAIKSHRSSLELSTKQGAHRFDRVLVTLTSPLFSRLTPGLPSQYRQSITNLRLLGAQTLILSLPKPLLPPPIYWLNINQPNYPFLAVVQHSHLVNPTHYSNRHLVYIGRYLDPAGSDFSMTKSQVLASYRPYLTKLGLPTSPIKSAHSWLFTSTEAQPLVFPNHHAQVPSLTTPIRHLYWASMQHIYPYDRGTNYAVELGIKAAARINQS